MKILVKSIIITIIRTTIYNKMIIIIIIVFIPRLSVCYFVLCFVSVSCCAVLLLLILLCPSVPPPFQGGVDRFDGMLDKGVFQSVSSAIEEAQPFTKGASLAADDSEQRARFTLHRNHVKKK